MSVSVKAIPLHSKLAGGLRHDLPVLFQILGGECTNLQSKPMNMAMVLDRSGSMNGSRLENAKQAIIEIFNLMSDGDRLHLVTYDDVVVTELENVPRALALEAQNRIRGIQSGNTTDLMAGIEHGAEIVRKHKTSESIDVVFLFSDGEPTTGVRHPNTIGSRVKELHQSAGICFSTFGIGDGFNEQLMSSIARCGKGNSFYIDRPERISDVVKKGYNGFTRIVARDLQLKVRGLGSSVLTELSDCEDLRAGKKFHVLREKGIYQVLGRVLVSGAIGEQEILAYRLSFTDETNGSNITSGPVLVEMVDSFSVQESEHPAVRCYMVMRECGKLNETATEALDDGETARALEIKQEIVEKYQQVVDLDELGLIRELLSKERAALAVLEREGASAHACKTTAYCSQATPGYTSNRPQYEDFGDAEEEDLHYALFD